MSVFIAFSANFGGGGGPTPSSTMPIQQKSCGHSLHWCELWLMGVNNHFLLSYYSLKMWWNKFQATLEKICKYFLFEKSDLRDIKNVMLPETSLEMWFDRNTAKDNQGF